MPPAKKKPATPSVQHTDTCAGPRVETYEISSPDPRTVTRCMECGAQTVEKV